MKNFLIFIIFMTSFLYSQEESKGKIVLPDTPIVIEDESKENIENKEKKSEIKRRNIDVEELSKIQMSKKFKEDIEEKKENEFSISSLQFSYGMYENFLVNMETARKMTNFSYFVSFLRNTRGSVGIDTNIYYNTERAIDDLYLNMEYNLTKEFAVSLDAGYYNRTLGLFTNSSVVNENKFYIPLKLKGVYSGEDFLTVNGTLSGQYFALKHKLSGDYTRTNLYEFSLELEVEKTWGKDNFLNGELVYNMCYDYEAEHTGGLSLRDRLPLLPYLSLQFGAGLFFFGYKGFFWFPELIIFYRIIENLNFKTGITGNVDFKKSERILNQNQIYYTKFHPSENWTYLLGIYYRPIETIVIGFDGTYDYYITLRNYAYNNLNGLYYIENRTNVNIFTFSPYVNFNLVEDLLFSIGTKIRIFDRNEILLLNDYEITLKLEYYFKQIGLNIGSQLGYLGPKNIGDNQVTPTYWKWNIYASQRVNESLQLEARFNNILNQKVFDGIYLPESGFSFDLGLTFKF
ncbi:MAG: hypothetical protein N2258_08590 [Brevinematales bacterium]|nr:hypothetical protein [Brevinematales bacterium]